LEKVLIALCQMLRVTKEHYMMAKDIFNQLIDIY